MGHSKKRKYPSIDEVLDRPWCYYCERDFDDLKVLMSHQKAKHYKCDKCNRRLNTAGGLNVHMSQVHKEELKRVENALESRSGLEVEIFGMEGIPEDILREHRERKSTEYWENARERQRLTGNAVAGASGNHIPGKRLKLPPQNGIKDAVARFLEAKKANEANLVHEANADFGASSQATYNAPLSSLAPPTQQSIPGYSISSSPALPSGSASDHIASLTNVAQAAAQMPSPAPDYRRPDSSAQPVDKKVKKSKDKTKLVYSSEDIVPEEMMLSALGLLLSKSASGRDAHLSAPTTDVISKPDQTDTAMTG